MLTLQRWSHFGALPNTPEREPRPSVRVSCELVSCLSRTIQCTSTVLPENFFGNLFKSSTFSMYAFTCANFSTSYPLSKLLFFEKIFVNYCKFGNFKVVVGREVHTTDVLAKCFYHPKSVNAVNPLNSKMEFSTLLKASDN